VGLAWRSQATSIEHDFSTEENAMLPFLANLLGRPLLGFDYWPQTIKFANVIINQYGGESG
jgi:hypothetical protein